MITLHNKDFTTEYGSINTICEAFVEEERNGLFELSFIMLNTDSLFNYVKEENIVVANANDTLLNQKFRIYMTRKLMNNRVEVFARHISFDLMYDYIDNLSFENQSCEYALNQLFRNSNFSTHYKGYSDIVNAQDYSISMANILEAIGGKSGSIIDTFGTGAEILRDNENISVLNRRGNDNEVTIEYRKNLTGFELEEDTTDLVTRILPYAKYNNEETNEEITVKADFVDSPLINNYSHPYIKTMDYSERFDDSEIPTIDKLIALAKKEYSINKVDIPKQNFKIDFIPLSKCVGYEGIDDKISLCDTVTIIDTRYNINTQAKVIKTVFNVLKNRYESIELGEPKTSLGDIIGGSGDDEPVVGPPGPQGPPGEDGKAEDFPNTLPAVPVLESFVYGFANIELSWTFESKIYYQYELYASKVKDFTPNTFDLIFQGQASRYMFQAEPDETWYFRVCAINTHGERTEFSNQVTVTTTKIEDLSNYVENMAIGDALIGELSLDRGWIGKLNANLLDVKGNFSVTNGNGKRTLDIDSFGNVHLDVAEFSVNSQPLEEAIEMSGTNLIPNTKILNLDGWEAFNSCSIEKYIFSDSDYGIPPIIDIPSTDEPSEDIPSDDVVEVLPKPSEPPAVTEPPVSIPTDKENVVVVPTHYKAYLYNVDDGLCMLIRNGDINILVDCAEEGKAINRGVISHIKNLGITKLNHVIITHFHSDHVAGFKDFANNFDIENVYYKTLDTSKLHKIEKDWKTDTYYNEMLSICNTKGINKVAIKNNYSISNAGIKMFVGDTSDNYNNYNRQSLSMILTMNGKKLFIAGDIIEDVEKMILPYLEKCDAMVVAHHCYNGSNCQEILSKVEPYLYFVPAFSTSQAHQKDSVNRIRSMNPNFFSTHNNGSKIELNFNDGNNITHSAKIKV